MTMRRVLLGISLFLIVTLVALIAFAGWLVRRPHPQTSGEALLPGLSAPVEVLRDDWGVPHLYASDAEDLFRAQGYVHAQDRFWQMEMNRRIGSGRLAELFGEAQLETDRFLRTLGWRRVAEEEWALLSERTRTYLDAYADGVNAYLDGRSPGQIAFEYAVIGLQNRDLTVEPWDPIDTLVWVKVMAWDLRANMESEIQRALLAADLPVERVEQLWPDYPERHPHIVGGGEVEDGVFVPEDGEAPESDGASGQHVALTEDVVAQLRDLSAALGATDALADASGPGIGSNSWVVDGSRSATGEPLLVNDPHLGPGLPSIWYEVGLHCRTVDDDCPFDVRGFSFAGLPGIVTGRNARIAWGVTNLGADVTDLVIERVDPDAPDRYEVEGELVEMEVLEEEIAVAGQDPVTHRVRLTRNGPVMSDVSEQMASIERTPETTVTERDEHVISLRWTALEPSPTIEALFALNVADDWDAFRDAASLFDVPAQNLVFADVDGNIGYQTPGRIPRRSSGDGRWPVPGWTGEFEWDEHVPFHELPSVLNPDIGYIVTANNSVVDEGYPHHLTASSDWSQGYRARRIVDMLEASDGFSVADMNAMMLDAGVISADELLPYLTDVELDDDRLVEARELLADWDRQMTADSAGGALYAGWWRHLLLRTFTPEVPPEFLVAQERFYEVVHRLAEDPTDEWWDDPGTDEREERDDIMRLALADAVDELSERLGDDMDAWRWGELHTLEVVHNPLGSSGIGPIERLVNRGPYRTGGSSGLVNATGWSPPAGYGVNWLPSYRMVIDLGDPSSSTGIHTTGQSGHPFHEHYVDMAEPWSDGTTKSMWFTRDDVEKASEAQLVLIPRAGQ